MTLELETLTEILMIVKRIEASLSKSKASASASKAEGDIATDADLDGKYGDEEIRRDPSSKYWEGESYISRRMSECPADYLDAYAKYKNACAFMNEKEGKEDKAKYVGYDRKSAARARGWAQRLRSGYKAPEKSTTDDDSVPF